MVIDRLAYDAYFEVAWFLEARISKALKIQNSTLLILRNLQQDCAECDNLTRIQNVEKLLKIVHI